MQINPVVNLSVLGVAILMVSCQQPSTDQPATTTSPTLGVEILPEPPISSVPETTTVPESSEVLSKQEVAQRFFEAYKAGDRISALKVATEDAVKLLTWDASAGKNPTLELDGTDFIYYEGGGINLTLTGDDQTGYNVTDAQPIAD
ncbi:MAG: hypothetical protein WA902_22335 [Thermosynechococcaceae cyanobacterium]